MEHTSRLGQNPYPGRAHNKGSNTPGTAGGPGGRDRTLAVKIRKNGQKISFFSRKKIKFTPKKIFFLHISSSYAKILGDKLFHTRETPRSGSKAEGGEKERKKDKTMMITMAKLRMAHASTHGARKPLGARKHAWRSEAAWANI